MFELEYQCDICQHFFDHPVDACPLCGEPFYWLVVLANDLQDSQRTAFLQMMEDIVEGNVGRDFITHGENLWLPHNFWQYSPDGSILNTFAWIKNIRLIQHDNPQKRQFFDRQENPTQPSSQPQQEDESDNEGFDTQPIPIVQPEPPQPARSLPNIARLGQPTKLPSELIAPVAIALLFVFLAASFFTLCAQRNIHLIQRAQQYEQQLLP